MRSKVITIGLLVFSATVMLAATASAQLRISGWGGGGYSAVTMFVDLKGVPANKDAIARVTVALEDIEIFCRNPNDNLTPASPGNAGDRTVSGVNQVDPQEIFGKGQAHLEFTFPLDFAESDEFCLNNWKVVDESAAVSKWGVLIETFKCTGGSDDPDPCFDGPTLTGTLQDTVTGVCIVNPVLRDLDPLSDTYLQPLHGQIAQCEEVASGIK